MHALHAEEIGSPRRDAGDTHERAADGSRDPLGKLYDLIPRSICDDASAKVDEGALGAVDGTSCCLEVSRIGHHLLRPELHLVVLQRLYELALDIGRDVHKDRTLPPGVCEREGLVHDVLEPVCRAHEVVVLRYGQRDACDIKLLEGVRADHLVAHVAGDCDKRDGVEVGRGDAGHEIRGART